MHMLRTKAPKGQTTLGDNTKNNSIVSLRTQPINEVQHGQRAITYVLYNSLPKNILRICLILVLFFQCFQKLSYSFLFKWSKINTRELLFKFSSSSSQQWNATPFLSKKKIQKHKEDVTA